MRRPDEGERRRPARPQRYRREREWYRNQLRNPAAVAAAAGRPEDAARAALAALDLYRAKGNRAGAALAEAAAQPSVAPA